MNVILTGATGMVGEGVLIECLQNAAVEKILVVARKPLNITHPKLESLVIDDFMKLSASDDRLSGYDACFFCAGISSNGLSEETYTHITYTTTMHVARILKSLNPDLVFNFVSGASTDSTAKGKSMWARVKGRTENELRELFPGAQYSFRPALMKPFRQQIHLHGYNGYLWLLGPILSPFFGSSTIQQVARAMIRTANRGYEKTILEVQDINKIGT